MSHVSCPVGLSPLLEQLKWGDTIEGLPYTTLWWRQRLFPDEDGSFCSMQVDNPASPKEVTFTWKDYYGPDDAVLRPYAARISCAEENPVLFGREELKVIVDDRPRYLDVLWHEPPTTGRWEALTSPGQHVHPDDRDEIDQLRRDHNMRLIPILDVTRK